MFYILGPLELYQFLETLDLDCVINEHDYD